MRTPIIFSISLALAFCLPLRPVRAAESDTLVVFDAARETPGAVPEGWRQVLPKNTRISTTYNIERSIEGNYLRARSAASGSWIEIDVDSLATSGYRYLSWRWKVDRFPDISWEQNPSQDDFALRIELVYDFPGSGKNPVNWLRKGLITTIFRRYPPERIVSYVWSVGVPSSESYDSPNDRKTSIIPIESNNVIRDRWMNEKVDILADLARLEPDKRLVLKKIRVRADTENSGTMAESGLKYLYLIAEPAK